MLEIKDLHVKIGNKEILKGINLKIDDNETHLIFGPNGCGKSSLVHTIIGLPQYKVTKGKIILDGKDITGMKIDERVKLGLGIQYQNPPKITGVKLKDMLNQCTKTPSSFKPVIEKLNMQNFLERDINHGFSGGEIKRSEILQLTCQQPGFALFDEPDSGVDIENIELLGKQINDILKKSSGIVITHSGHILRYIKAQKAHVIINGMNSCSGDAKEIFQKIQTCGFEKCSKCQM